MCGIEEHSRHDDAGGRTAVVEIVRGDDQRDLDLYVTLDVVFQIDSTVKIGDGLGVKDGLGVGIQNLDRLSADVVVPIDEVERQLMLLIVREGNVGQKWKTAVRIGVVLIVGGANSS